jgi:phosphoesterase RecJ-like protein
LKNFEFEQIADLIRKSGTIVVTSHHNPDGDAIGSVLTLSILLRKMGKAAVPMVPNEYPDFLKWMPGTDTVIIYEDNPKKASDLLKSADVIFCLDYNSISRTGKMAEPLGESKGIKILIDHHLQPMLKDFDFHYSVVETSSTSELLFDFIRQCGWADHLDEESATGLYVGIMTDTGSFSYSCDRPGTYEAVSALVRKGIQPGPIHRMVYDTYSESRLRLLGYCLSDKLTILQEFKTAYIALSIAELDRFNHQVGDTEGIVNYALSIEGIRLAVFMTERTDRIRLSFRSKGNFSVNTLARDHFNGGGHLNAAGGDSFVSMDETIARLKEVLAQYREQLNRSEEV